MPKLAEGYTAKYTFQCLEKNMTRFEAGIVFKQFVPSVEYEEVITELREKFIDKRYVSYVQEFVSKDGKPLKVVAFYKIENKLLAGHRVIKVSAAVIE